MAPNINTEEDSPRFTETLKEAAGEQWERVVNHKFTKELADGTIDRNVLKRYLVQDHKFLDAFVILLSSMIANARCLQDRIIGCQFLALITGMENTYFERCFEELKCTETEREQVGTAEVASNFISLMKDVSYQPSSPSKLGEILAVLVVCEWSYLSWGSAVSPHTNRDKSCWMMYEWVDLHSGEMFENVVEYLRHLLDKEGKLLDEEGRKRCLDRFLEAIKLEEEFFEFAYRTEEE